MNIPSYLIKPGDVVGSGGCQPLFCKIQQADRRGRPHGDSAPVLEREKNTLKGTVVKMPVREDIDLPVEEHLIVELYSK